MTDLPAILDRIAADMAAETARGAVAAYIPELAAVDPGRFGIAVVTADGREHMAGDAALPFSIQSVSKVFTLALALGKLGDECWSRVGREPSGDPFNSIVQLEADDGIPRNPFINAGAIVVSDILLDGSTPEKALAGILAFVRRAAEDDAIGIDEAVAASETRTGFRNAALANFMRAAGNLHHDPAETLRVYFNQCAIAMNCLQLARAGRMLAFSDRAGPAGAALLSRTRARRINALMLTCGHYDGSGQFAFDVGLPGKSGVGGGILAVAPDVASISVWSPGLNAVGNSHLGTLALERLGRETGWSVFGAQD